MEFTSLLFIVFINGTIVRKYWYSDYNLCFLKPSSDWVASFQTWAKRWEVSQILKKVNKQKNKMFNNIIWNIYHII